MFGEYFYHRLTWKYIVLFGALFKNIKIKRMSADFSQEIEWQNVDIVFAQKEKYMARLQVDSMNPAVQVILPRMSYEMTGWSYDRDRKKSNLNRYATLRTDTNSMVYASYEEAPYNIEFNLYVYARNIEDAAQVVEQILPYFQPDYTPTVDLLQYLKIPKDIRISLLSVSPIIESDGTMDQLREVVWELRFSMQAYFFGPVTDTPLIARVIANTYISKGDDNIGLNLGTGNGNYTIDDTVYQGFSREFATAAARVNYFQNLEGNKKLYVNMVQGTFTLNNEIKSISTNASYILSSFEAPPVPLVTFIVTPNPLTANANSVFGVTIDKFEDGQPYGLTLASFFTNGERGAAFDPNDKATLFQDIAMTLPVTANGQPVAVWLDKSGNGNHLLQSNTVARPIYRSDENYSWIESNGTNQWMIASFSISQPWERFSVIRQLSWTSSDCLFAGANVNAGILFQSPTTPRIRLFDGGGSGPLSANAAIGTDVIVREKHAGANSTIALNRENVATANSGLAVAGGLTLFAQSNGTQVANIRCYALLMREGTLNSEQFNNMITLLSQYGNVS